MANIVLINPRFEESYWGFDHSINFLGKKAGLPVASLPLLAALTPPGHTITLIDENVQPIDLDAVARADIVGVTGLSVQRFRMKELVTALKERGAFVVVGGAWVTVREDYFGDAPDVIFVGEAEETWPVFLQEWQEGRHGRRYEQADKTDMTKVPTPRFDLLNMKNYMFGSVQFSRGCPFQCEFCDIIVTFGRRPRLKTTAQVLAEFEALRAQGMRIVFVVDDNLIGNKKAIKVILRDVIAWQQANGYPLTLFTEASLDLAEDPELMDLMTEAGFISVFVGIESPSEESLKETKKYQNVRQGTSIVDRVHTIQEAGLEVWCGMILGFDNDGPEIFRAQREFVRQARIPQAMIGMLHAIPKTPLHARLEREGRLDPDDRPAYGTNVIPRRMTRDELRRGYVQLMDDLYQPEAFFGRLEELYLDRRIPYAKGRARWLRFRPWQAFRTHGMNALRAVVLYRRLMKAIPEAEIRREYRRRFLRFLKVRRDPGLAVVYLLKFMMHYHHHTASRRMLNGHALVNSF